MEETKADWAICKRAVVNGNVGGGSMEIRKAPKLDVPKPKEYYGKRDANAIDNFVWHMENNFCAFIGRDRQRQVELRSYVPYRLGPHLVATKHEEIKKGTCTINTWATFVTELKKQFYPKNVSFDARSKMK